MWNVWLPGARLSRVVLSHSTVEPQWCHSTVVLSHSSRPLLLRDTIAASIFDGSRRTSPRHQASKRPRVQLPPMVKFDQRQQDSLTSLVAASTGMFCGTARGTQEGHKHTSTQLEGHRDTGTAKGTQVQTSQASVFKMQLMPHIVNDVVWTLTQ